MAQPVIVHGRYAGGQFIPDEPMPETEGKAELVITPAPVTPMRSIAEAFGKAPVLRSKEDIMAQVRAEREEWGDR